MLCTASMYGIQPNCPAVGLPRTIMWQGLKDMFVRFGAVKRADVYAGGVGQVTFESPNDARAAAAGLNGFVLEGQQLRVALS